MITTSASDAKREPAPADGSKRRNSSAGSALHEIFTAGEKLA